MWDGSRDVRRQKRSVQHGENIAKGFGNQQKGLGTSGFLGLKMIVASDALGLWG